jgi:hypothetical protein
MFEVKFKKRRVIMSLLAGIAWCVFGVIYLLFKDNPLFFSLNFLMGIGYLWKYAYETTKPYITITEEFICKFSFFKRQVFTIKAITSIKHPNDDFANEFLGNSNVRFSCFISILKQI